LLDIQPGAPRPDRMLQYRITIVIPISRRYFIAKWASTMPTHGGLYRIYINHAAMHIDKPGLLFKQAFIPIRLKSRLCVHFEPEGLVYTYRVEGQWLRSSLPDYS
jgi:hypothetical protein